MKLKLLGAIVPLVLAALSSAAPTTEDAGSTALTTQVTVIVEDDLQGINYSLLKHVTQALGNRIVVLTPAVLGEERDPWEHGWSAPRP